MQPRAREELEADDERDWVALSLPPRAFARAGQWLSAADGAPTPLARVLYAILGLYPPFFLFVGIGGANILTMYSNPVWGPTWVGFATFFACVGLGGFHSLRRVATSVDADATVFERGHLQQLGVASRTVPAAAKRSLARWSGVIGVFVSLLALGMTFIGFASGQIFLSAAYAAFYLFNDVCFLTFGAWWISLKVGAAVADATCCNHGDGYRVDNLGDQRQSPDGTPFVRF